MIKNIKKENKTFPLLPLRDVVIFPDNVVTFIVGRSVSLKALEASKISEDSPNEIVLCTQIDDEKEDVKKIDDIYKVGIIASVIQVINFPDNSAKVVVKGIKRTKVVDFKIAKGMITVEVEDYPTKYPENKNEIVLKNSIIEKFKEYIATIGKKVARNSILNMENSNSVDYIIDQVLSFCNFSTANKQKVLEVQDIVERVATFKSLADANIEVFQLERGIHEKIKSKIEKNQKEYYINEQMQILQKELGRDEEQSDQEYFLKLLKKKSLQKDIQAKLKREIGKLNNMNPASAEASVLRNYLDVVLNMPWGEVYKKDISIQDASDILDKNHYGLRKVKTRILEEIAMQKRQKQNKANILCFVGPPGIGKTSLVQSIAAALGRKFQKISLGGLKDESEIRGHRKTYIGSMPGKVINALRKVEVDNPVVLLDEIDKLSSDYRGDPASALLEVLDPEQNSKFNDHYLEMDYDLSKVMFIATANSLDIPLPMLDRMEIIELTGYTEDEKLSIANDYIIPRLKEDFSIKKGEFFITDDVLRNVIRKYTRESGVRNLTQIVASLVRKVIKRLDESKDKKDVSTEVRSDDLQGMLGVAKYPEPDIEKDLRPGVAIGLAWTKFGGDILYIEVVKYSGKGKITYTGSMGNVMKESIDVAYNYIKANCEKYGINMDEITKSDLHIHIPEGATPKDGPSAGAIICLAMISVLTGKKVRELTAMTGELSLRGKIHAIGGLKEKILAAKRFGIKTVIIPKDNENTLVDIDKDLLQDIEIKSFSDIEQAIRFLL